MNDTVRSACISHPFPTTANSHGLTQSKLTCHIFCFSPSWQFLLPYRDDSIHNRDVISLHVYGFLSLRRGFLGEVYTVMNLLLFNSSHRKVYRFILPCNFMPIKNLRTCRAGLTWFCCFIVIIPLILLFWHRNKCEVSALSLFTINHNQTWLPYEKCK